MKLPLKIQSIRMSVVDPLCDVLDVAEQLVITAKLYGCRVVIVFNGIPLESFPETTVDAVHYEYFRTREAIAETEPR